MISGFVSLIRHVLSSWSSGASNPPVPFRVQALLVRTALARCCRLVATLLLAVSCLNSVAVQSATAAQFSVHYDYDLKATRSEVERGLAVGRGLDKAAGPSTPSGRSALLTVNHGTHPRYGAGQLLCGSRTTVATNTVNGVNIKGLMGRDGDVVVLGRLEDTAVAKGWNGHVALDTPNCNLAVGACQGVVAAGSCGVNGWFVDPGDGWD